ncbi:MAG: hypothetical protein MR828_09930 [Clostridiales bacterium]|nr:hypothetical protein [Clostridiales bacterium]
MIKNHMTTSFLDGNVVKYEHNMAFMHKLLWGDPMGWWIIVGFLTAFGALCTVLTLYGALLHRTYRGIGICLITPVCSGDEAMFYLWLKSLGILKCKILEVESRELWNMLEKSGKEITRWDSNARPGTGAEEIDRAGNGDSSGHHQRGGVSEL